jgi:trimeric autotransporter adhesin
LKPFRKVKSSLLAAVFLVSLLLTEILPAAGQPAAIAAGNDDVLTSLGHSSTDTVTGIATDHVITLTVPASYSATEVDLFNGLSFTYNTALYKSVVASPSGTAQIDGPAVLLTVTYNYITDTDSTQKEQTFYQILVVHAAKISETFTGTVSAEVQAPSPGTVTIPYADFVSKYTKNDGESFGFITITGSNPAFGAIKVDSHDYTFGTRINPTSVITFTATLPGTVSYDVTAYTVTDTSKSNPIGNVILTVLAYTTPLIVTPISDTVSKGTIMTFTKSYFTSHCNLYGVPLISIEITPTNTTFGTWYLGTAAFSAKKAVSADQLENLTFKANSAGTATFNWSVTTKAILPATGTGSIIVTSPVLVLTPFTSSVSILRGNTWTVSPTDFDYTTASAALSYVKITAIPAAIDGYLYLDTALPKNDTAGYPAIAANTALTTNTIIPASSLYDLCLATKTTSLKDSVTFKWTATADAKISTAAWGTETTYTVPFISGGSLPLYSPYYYLTDMNTPLPLASSDIISNYLRLAGTANPLTYVTFTIPDKSIGTLYLNYNASSKTGTAVTAATKYYPAKNPNLLNITFVPAKDYIGTFDLSYTAYAESGAFITGKIKISVQNSPGGTVSCTTDKNSAIQLDAKDFQAAFLSATGKVLSSISFPALPSASYGTLYYNYTLSGEYDSLVFSSYYATQQYNVYESPYLSLISFVPYTDYTGTVSISFRGYTESNVEYDGKLIISVVDSPAGIVKYSAKENAVAALSAADFSQEFINVTGSVLSYVTFTPPVATAGVLYYQYSADTQKGTKVAASTKYYNGQNPDISDITFVPAKDFVGTCVISYTAFTVNGASYTGKLVFTVYEGSGVITYSVQAGSSVSLDSNDFVSAFNLDSGGKTLSYITFEIPAASYGKLYYNYTSPTKFDSVVSGDKKYYVTETPFISNISFIPQESYSGSFSVNYSGYTSSGTIFTGKIKFIVSGVSSNTVSYETTSSTPVTFRAADFISAFTGKSSYALSYVKFTLPYDSYGTLYDNYAYSSVSNVLPTSLYYVNSISNVTFVPNTNFSGTIAIYYTAIDTSGCAYGGTVVITVQSSDIGTVTYNANLNKPVLFNADDFSTAFLSKTGSALYSVTFTLPSPTAGKLYLGYNPAVTYSTAVTASSKYYRSFSPLLSDISFVPASGYYGTVTILYSAYTAAGAVYYGKIIINIGTNLPFTDITSNYAWAKDAISYLYRSGIITDTDSGKYNPGDNMTRGDFIVMIARAFNLTNLGSDNFSDVPIGSTYYDAVSAAKSVGIVLGSGGMFYPDSGITRQDAMVILVRALNYAGAPVNAGTLSDISGFSDASQVSDYAVIPVATLVKTGIVGGSAGALHPKAMVSRAEIAVMLYRILLM